ncbi:PstS family phosphate ABC transporter substrate-binding protein [Janthinobacterium violaceinigrum]|uniref:Phosphate-binding protein n=1 Tax=Janthinobacterium violaceinigrum TaxID=2654252 RepID=A0A6I1I7C3_9BURK|nr:substrate-binding domain-containing protein [Janthinobacterium violaceinigrum]KAB8062958.1 phosphate-binding protein [Janthinobacterium violaceinigrum]
MTLLNKTALAACCVLAAAAQAAPLAVDPAQTYVNRDGTVAIVGNDGLEEVITQLNALFTRQHPQVRFSLRMEGSSAGMPALTAGATAFAPLTRDMWPGDQAAFRQVFGYDATPVRIGYNGHGPRAPAKTPPAVYVHRDNPLAGLTMEQLGQVFTAGAPRGDVNLWSQLGATGDWAPRRIHAYGLRDDGGFATGLRHARFGKRPFAARYEALASREAVIRAVAADRYGIAVLGWVNAAPISDQVRVLPLAAAQGAPYYGPDKATVRAGNYPLTMPVQLYVNRAPGKGLDPLVKAYLQLALSPQGQAIILAQQDSEEGYLPLSEQDLQAELKKLDAL